MDLVAPSLLRLVAHSRHLVDARRVLAALGLRYRLQSRDEQSHCRHRRPRKFGVPLRHVPPSAQIVACRRSHVRSSLGIEQSLVHPAQPVHCRYRLVLFRAGLRTVRGPLPQLALELQSGAYHHGRPLCVGISAHLPPGQNPHHPARTHARLRRQNRHRPLQHRHPPTDQRRTHFGRKYTRGLDALLRLRPAHHPSVRPTPCAERAGRLHRCRQSLQRHHRLHPSRAHLLHQ